MEFSFDINNIFPERITVLDQSLVPGDKSKGRPDLQSKIASVIDELGKASSKAQQLPAPITSAVKLQSNQHSLYLIKDETSNGGQGAGVGFLKVGYKKLFLLDQRGAHLEAEPLCVLDFYVSESLQRHGYGLELFDFMLQHTQMEPALMAYDRPSAKFLAFLAKHYCLTQSVPQVNNFVVYEGFFLNKSVGPSRKGLPKKVEGEIKPYSLMEREALRGDQRVGQWPFPPQVGSSPYSRSHSVGSSPSRAPPAQAPPQGPAPASGGPPTPHSLLSDHLKARRTSKHKHTVARGNHPCCHIDSSSGLMLNRDQAPFHRPGWRLADVLRDRGTDIQPVGNTNTHRPRPPSLPPLLAPRKPPGPAPPAGRHERAHRMTGARGAKTELLPRRQAPPGPWEAGATRGGQRALLGGPWSWTLGEGPHTAQWVRQKQEYRSTRPW
ncbi:alpha-tubulin N-acetyltransferase 1 isoform X1 [Gadus macrocephalus]|uniref:alpha-tubulin N-acetyltransferase 1 isoform X1 n=1 Tax=Gadus macrocephalus TaxID=80720 RepID=UPI0028CB9048|nr:alpha-tubulin N-acetyltransferase 1 isoform X1 [Gadus macrocephalus]